MARRIVLAFAAAFVVCTLSGCGTVGNLWCCCRSGDEAPYGGVVNSVKLARSGFEEGAKLDSLAAPAYFLGATYCLLVDAPLSAVADTVTLPITIPATLKKQKSPPLEDVNPADYPWPMGIPQAVPAVPPE